MFCANSYNYFFVNKNSLGTKDITESYNNFAATNIIEILMNREKIYSAFPCPKL